MKPTNPTPPHVNSARKRAMACLATGEALRTLAASNATDAQKAAVAAQGRLQGELPALREAIESAPDNDARQAAQRAYLQATSDAHRSEQAFQIARRQELISI